MGYNPGISYRGDLHISNGFRGLGRGIEDAGRMMGVERMRNEDEDKQLQQDAKTYDFLAKQGYIDAADLMGMSPREKSQQVRGLMDATRIGSQVQQMDYQKLMGQNLENQMNAPAWQPKQIDFNNDGTPDMLMTSPNSAVPVPSDSKDQVAYPWHPGMPPQVLLGPNTVGVVDPKGGYYRPQNVKYSKVGNLGPQGYVESMAPNIDTANIPSYQDVVNLMGGPGVNTSSDPSGVDISVQDKPAESELADMDKQALEWANANPSDPRAAQIKAKLGVQ